MSSLYRDPLASLRERVAERRAEVERRRPSPAERDMLSDDQERSLSLLEAAAKAQDAAAPDVLTLTALEQALTALSAAYDDALKDLATRLRLPLEVDDLPKVGSPPPWVVEETWHRRFENSLRLLLSELAVDVEVQRVGDHAYHARTRYDEAALCLRFSLRIPRGFQFASELYALDVMPAGTSLEVLLRTGAPAAAPRVYVQRASLMDRAKLLVGLVHEAKVDDEPFDDAFLLDCPEPLARYLFSARVRGLMLQMPNPSVLLQDGYVETRVQVSHMPKSAELRRWVQLLLELRARFSAMREDVRARRAQLSPA